MEIKEESKQYTAFTLGPLGFFECNRMSFGATNAPATFQRLMESCLGDLTLNWCIIYLDDVVVYAPTVKEHLVRLEAVFQKLKDAATQVQTLPEIHLLPGTYGFRGRSPDRSQED